MSRISGVAFAAIALSAPAWAHHGFGRFDPTKDVTLEGTLTGIDFVNPHSLSVFRLGRVRWQASQDALRDARGHGAAPLGLVAGDVRAGQARHGRRQASSRRSGLVLRRDTEIGDSPTLERYQQLTPEIRRRPADRPPRLPSGKPNLAGDWAQEQYLIARPPSGRGGPRAEKPSRGGREPAGSPSRTCRTTVGCRRPVTFTPAGQGRLRRAARPSAARESARRCEITSILMDWVFDGPINRITQAKDLVTLQYGRGLTRTIHMDGRVTPPTSSRAEPAIRSAVGTATRSS